MHESIELAGHWISGPNAGCRAVAFDVRAGRLHAQTGERKVVFGLAQDFRADTRESGESLLQRLLPPPRLDALFHGLVRESLASAASIARIGRPETRAWERLDQYVVDDSQGNAGVVQFVDHSCVGAVSSHDTASPLDRELATQAVPRDLSDAFAALITLPFLAANGRSKVTAVFWSEGNRITGPATWSSIFIAGAELLRRELLDDDVWVPCTAQDHDFPRDLAALIVSVSTRRRGAREVLVLNAEECARLLPSDGEFRDEALDELARSGAFQLHH